MPNVVSLQPWLPSGPVGTTPAEIAALGAALGREAIGAFVAGRHGIMPQDRRPHDAIAMDAGEELEELLDAIGARIGTQAAAHVVNTLCAGMIAELGKRLAFGSEADADEAAALHNRE